MQRKALIKQRRYMINKKYEKKEEYVKGIEEIETEQKHIGVIINNSYIIIKYIGMGTFSRVFLCYSVIDFKYYVAKLFLPKERDEYLNEIRKMKVIDDIKIPIDDNKLRNLTIKYNCEQYINGKNVPIIIMPFMGETLEELCNMCDYNLSIKSIKYIMRELCICVRDLHRRGIFHADLKLDNFLTMYFNKKIIRFIDFFNSLDLMEKYKQRFNELKPADYDNYRDNKNVRGKINLKIRKTINSQFIEYIIGKIEQYYDNIKHNGSDDDGDGDNDADSDIDIDADSDDTDYKEQKYIDMHNTGLEIEMYEDKYKIDFCKLSYILCDYSNSTLFRELNKEEEYEIRPFRAIENILGYPITPKAEVWSLGAIFIKILTDQYIFEKDDNEKEDGKDGTIKKDRHQIALFMKYLDNIDIDYALDAPYADDLFIIPNEYANQKLKVKGYNKIHKDSLYNFVSKHRPDLESKDIYEFCEFVKNMLKYNVDERYSLDDCINSNYLKLNNVSL